MVEARLQCRRYQKKKSQHIQNHPVLGKLYGLELTQKKFGYREKKVQGENLNATDKKQTRTAGHPGATREEKARASEEARECKDKYGFCEKYLGRCTKVVFQPEKNSYPKLVKSLPECIKEALFDALSAERTAHLAQTQKA